MTQTAPWPYSRVDAEDRDFELTEAHIAAIRTCVVYWEAAEHGAAGLADADFLEIEDHRDELYRALEVFLDVAKLSSFAGTVRNPYANPDDVGLKETLENIPDEAVAALFRSGSDFEFAATEQDRALWSEANLGARGIDCKRPFGSRNVSSDIRAVIDPDKAIKRGAFSKLTRVLEARMAMMLQFFVQNAVAAPGLYYRDVGVIWQPLDPAKTDAVETVAEGEWAARVERSFHYQTGDYIETGKAIWHLVWGDRLKGKYSELSERLRLDDSYAEYPDADYTGETLAQAQKGLGHFPETSGNALESALTLMTVRMLNAHARFEEALALFESSRLTPKRAPFIDFEKPAWAVVLILEHLVARLGSGDMTAEAFEDAMNGRCDDYDYEPRASYNSRVYDITYELGLPDNLPMGWLRHLQAICIQIKIMQGPYIPDEE